MSDIHISDEHLYTYNAVVRSVYDADTFRLDIDLGMNIWLYNEPVRLGRVDAWELRGAERAKGIAARDWLREHMLQGTQVIIQTRKDGKGKYGRYIVDVCHPELGDVAKALVEAGHGKWYEY